MEGTLMMLSGMVGLHGIEPFTYESAALGIRFPEIYAMFSGLHGVAFLVGVTAIAFLAPNSEQIPRPRHPAFAVALAMVVLVTLTTFMEETPFLYFRF